MAIRGDFETRRGRQAQRNYRVGIGDIDVVFGRGREAQLDGAIAIIDFRFAADIFHIDVVTIGAQLEISGRIGNFQIAGPQFQMSAELSECQITALRNITHAPGNLVGAYWAVKFSVDGKTAGCGGNVDFATFAGQLDVALGVGNFYVAVTHVDGDGAGGIADVHITVVIVDDDRAGDIGDHNVAFFVAN